MTTIKIEFLNFTEICSNSFSNLFPNDILPENNEFAIAVRDILKEAFKQIIDEAQNGKRDLAQPSQEVKYPVPTEKWNLSFDPFTIKPSEFSQGSPKKAEIFSQEIFYKKDLCTLQKLSNEDEISVDGEYFLPVLEVVPHPLKFSVSLKKFGEGMYGKTSYNCVLSLAVRPLYIDCKNHEIYYPLSIHLDCLSYKSVGNNNECRVVWEGLQDGIHDEKLLEKKEPPLQISYEDVKEKDKQIEKILKESKLNKHKRLCIHIPSGTTWKDIKILFENSHDVIIQVNGMEICKTDYMKIGFAKKGKGKPNIQWEFLYDLADTDDGKVTKEMLKKYARTLHKTQADSEDKIEEFIQGRSYGKNNLDPKGFHEGYLKQEFKNIKQIKKRLADKLKEVFGIQENPFYATCKGEPYHIKLQLEIL